jgi:hypothetical protein
MRPLALLILGFVSCSSPTPPTAPFSDRVIATIPGDLEVWVPPAFSRDGGEVAFVTKSKSGDQVVHGKWTSGPLDLI